MGIPDEHFRSGPWRTAATIIPNFDPELLSDDPVEAMNKQLVAGACAWPAWSTSWPSPGPRHRATT